MKFKSFIPSLILFLVGVGITIVGALFKIQHWPFGPELLTIGTFIELLAIFWVIIVLIRVYSRK